MNYSQALDYLNSFINYENNLQQISPKAFSLERVKKLLRALGSPDKELRIIHVAGTKGKGSTCAFAASILSEAGYRVGLYTSPHINHVRERIRIADKNATKPPPVKSDVFPDMISENELATLITDSRSVIEALKEDKECGSLTFFEVLTSLALVHFARNNTDFVILETGLGGRLDATNAAGSLIAVITPIGLEHTHLLGDTLEKITFEKKAIIKEAGQKVILAPQEKEVLALLVGRCQDHGIEPVIIGENMHWSLSAWQEQFQVCRISTAQAVYQDMCVPLMGDHQLVNACAAVGIMEQLMELGYPVSNESIYLGLKNTYWPLRFERLPHNKHIILDGAHTVSSSKALADTFEKAYPEKKATLIVGFNQGKDIRGMCAEFGRVAKRVIATHSCHPHSHRFNQEELGFNFPGIPYQRVDSVKDALSIAAKESGEDDVLLISGSLYLVSEARALCTS